MQPYIRLHTVLGKAPPGDYNGPDDSTQVVGFLPPPSHSYSRQKLGKFPEDTSKAFVLLHVTIYLLRICLQSRRSSDSCGSRSGGRSRQCVWFLESHVCLSVFTSVCICVWVLGINTTAHTTKKEQHSLLRL